MLGHSCLADLPHCAATASGSIALLPVGLPLAHSPATAATPLLLLPLRRPPLLPVAGTVKGRQVMAGKSACRMEHTADCAAASRHSSCAVPSPCGRLGQIDGGESPYARCAIGIHACASLSQLPPAPGHNRPHPPTCEPTPLPP